MCRPGGPLRPARCVRDRRTPAPSEGTGRRGTGWTGEFFSVTGVAKSFGGRRRWMTSASCRGRPHRLRDRPQRIGQDDAVQHHLGAARRRIEAPSPSRAPSSWASRRTRSPGGGSPAPSSTQGVPQPEPAAEHRASPVREQQGQLLPLDHLRHERAAGELGGARGSGAPAGPGRPGAALSRAASTTPIPVRSVSREFWRSSGFSP